MERGCETCKYFALSENDSPCNECMHCYNSEWEPMTNADRIRSMSDEELAQFLVNFKNSFGEEHEGGMSCLDWLKAEEKGE